MVGPLRELLSPPAFRMWAAVDQARLEMVRMAPEKAQLLLAAKVGVTVEEARRFLKQFPLAARPPSQASRPADFIPSAINDQEPQKPQDLAHWHLAEDASLSLERAGAPQRN
jgi:hypothetical protein